VDGKRGGLRISDTLVFHNGRIILADSVLEDAVVLCESGRITAIREKGEELPRDALCVDLEGGYLAPGYVDIHVHGGGGSDFMDGTVEAFNVACRVHARHGTTLLFPTTTTAPPKELAKMLDACRVARNQWTAADGARIGGIHLYGPYFAKEKSGCHRADACRDPLPEEYEHYFESGLIRVATCAAELPGAIPFYEKAHQHQCLITCGHSNASWLEMESAFRAGMRHVDHFWCAMSSVSSVRARLGVPMQGSMLEFVLAEPEMSTEVIADGSHLAPELLRFAFRMKGARRLCLVTDANRAVDLPPGRYRFGSEASGTWFESDGEVGWAGSGSLASSVRGMDHMVRIMYRDSTATLSEVVRMASLTPAERLGIDREVGSIEVGKQADLVVLDRELAVQRVIIGGVDTL
jgi:N-acetylglucosamine-6-phosphate deacetylase